MVFAEAEERVETVLATPREALLIGTNPAQPMLLLHRDATVTVCHTGTRDLAEHARRADILVAATSEVKSRSSATMVASPWT